MGKKLSREITGHQYGRVLSGKEHLRLRSQKISEKGTAKTSHRNKTGLTQRRCSEREDSRHTKGERLRDRMQTLQMRFGQKFDRKGRKTRKWEVHGKTTMRGLRP